MLTVLAMPLADTRVVARTPGHLRIPLDQWRGITIELGGHSITFTAAEIFAALQEKS